MAKSPSMKAGGRIQPGEVRNPEGKNIWTYRRDFERAIAKLLNDELTNEEAESIPEWVRDLVSPGMTRGQALASIAVAGALRGEGKHFDEVLKRVWPATEKRELTGADGAPLETSAPHLVDLSNLSDGERAEAQRLAHKALFAKPEGE